jgi:hypothetical protein
LLQFEDFPDLTLKPGGDYDVYFEPERFHAGILLLKEEEVDPEVRDRVLKDTWVLNIGWYVTRKGS